MAVNRGRPAALIAVVIVLALAAWAWPREAREKPLLGLFSSLPIYWGESGSVNEALDRAPKQHWTRTELEQSYRLRPLDALDTGNLSGIKRLIMAQPRPLAPAENVALDQWVREGGHLLLFADPFLTEESRFAIGDKRRPQDVVLLSPILARWGLELTFDDRQRDTVNWVHYGGDDLPKRLGGRWKLVRPGAEGSCSLAAEGLIAQCRIGQGTVLAMADAAVLEADQGPTAGFKALTYQALAK